MCDKGACLLYGTAMSFCYSFTVKECIVELAPVMTSIINASIRNSCVPSSFKVAHIKPLIKKHCLDRGDLKNYRPNLEFIVCV